MKKTFGIAAGIAAMTCAATLCASEKGLYGDAPDATHAWAVHDLNRPYPKQVDAKPGLPPSDAIVLFDGTQASIDANWCDKDGKPTKWTVKDGLFVCTPKSGPACTKRPFGDAQFHVEWKTPVDDAKKHGQLAGNSGVFPMGVYEIQILNSYDPDPAAKVTRNYPDGLAGSVYGQNPPLVNACRAPGEWQTYDIIFHQPVWKNGKQVHPGTISVFLNGVLVQDNWELEGPTGHRLRNHLKEHETSLPWKLQDHNDPVQFRNIWIRELKPRTTNTTHGGPYVVKQDVRKLRDRIASTLFAQVDAERASKDDVRLALETLAYSTDTKYVETARKVCAAWEKRAASAPEKDKAQVAADRKDIAKWIDVLRRCNVLDLAGFPLAK